MFTIQDILDAYKVKSWKSVGNWVAIRKGGFWLYFQWQNEDVGYLQTGSTQYLVKS